MNDRRSFVDVLSDWYSSTQESRAVSSMARIQEPWDWRKWEEFNSVSIETLITDDYFFGWRGRYLYDRHKEDILELFDEITPKRWPDWCRKDMPVGQGLDKRVCCFEEGTRSGKTWKGSMIYDILIFKNIIIPDFGAFYPAIAKKGGKLGFLAMSRTGLKSRDVLFKEVMEPILHSPFFIDYFPPQVTLQDVLDFKRNPGVLKFPNNIGVETGSSMNTELEALGYTIIGALADEVNFYQTVEKSVKKEAELTGGRLDVAEIIFQDLYTRIDNQFNYKGIWPCWALLMMSSSARYPGDMTNKIEQRYRDGDSEIFFRKRMVWESRPDTFSGEFIEWDLMNMCPVDEDGAINRYEEVFGKRFFSEVHRINEEDVD